MDENAHNEAWPNCHQNFDLNLNLKHNGRESHVVVTTTIIIMFIVIVIKDYGGNMLIGGHDA